jgi:undecaprenyl-diphosphatase
VKFLRKLVSHPLILLVAVVAIAYLLFGDRLPEIDVEHILQELAQGLGKWTYLLAGVLAFLETGAFVGLVFPGETAVIVAGTIAGQGETSLVLTIAIVWFAAWAGDSVSFWVGRRLGRGFVLRHGPRVRITHERFAQVEDYFQRHGGKTILIGRFLGLVRALAPFIAGSSGMRYPAFLPYSVLGTGLWAATFSVLGYVLAGSLERAGEIAGRGTFLFGTVVVTIIVVVVSVRFLREERNRERAVRWMEEHAATRPLVALGRRVEPQARFLWNRLTPGGLGLEFTTAMAVLAVALFVVVGYASIVDGDPGPTAGDRTAQDIALDLRAGWLTDVSKVITALGSAPVTLLVTLAAAVVFGLTRRWAELVVTLVAVGLTFVSVWELKDFLGRPRPEDALISENGNAFPSGHAAHSVIYPWLALTFVVRVRRGLANATAIVVAGALLAGAIGLSRVYLGVHYLSDVNGGWALGVAWFALCAGVALVVAHFRNNQRLT